MSDSLSTVCRDLIRRQARPGGPRSPHTRSPSGTLFAHDGVPCAAVAPRGERRRASDVARRVRLGVGGAGRARSRRLRTRTRRVHRCPCRRRVVERHCGAAPCADGRRGHCRRRRAGEHTHLRSLGVRHHLSRGSAVFRRLRSAHVAPRPGSARTGTRASCGERQPARRSGERARVRQRGRQRSHRRRVRPFRRAARRGMGGTRARMRAEALASAGRMATPRGAERNDSMAAIE